MAHVAMATANAGASAVPTSSAMHFNASTTTHSSTDLPKLGNGTGAHNDAITSPQKLTIPSVGSATISPVSSNSRARGSMKGKHLMRSQALRETTSPPRTPSESRPPTTSITTVVVNHAQKNNHSTNVSPIPPGSLSPTPSTHRNPSPKSAQMSSGTASPQDSHQSPNFLDHEFPRLAQPKTKNGRCSFIGGVIKSTDKKPHLLEVGMPGNAPRFASASSLDKDTRGSTDGDEYSGDASPPEQPSRDRGVIGANKKASHRGGLFVKGTKPRLKSMGSSASADEVNSSGFISRDDSFEQYTDSNGVDLFQFFKETLNKNVKDRNTLIRIEKEMLALALDRSRNTFKFPPMSSYNRMLIHRVAAFYGMDHNVDATQQCVIAAITKATRVPEVRFRALIRDDEPRKSILKRESQSFDEYRRGMLRSSDHRGMLDRKAKSFEEREEEYERVKMRIFKKREMEAAAGGNGSNYWPQWGGSDSCSDQEGAANQAMMRPKVKNSHRLLKVQSLSVDHKPDCRPPVTKSHSFGGYGPGSGMHKGHSGSRFFSKQDSLGTGWRLSPSSSGYKTQSQSIRSDSVTPSPTGYESGGDQTPEPPNSCGVVWAVTDMAAVPPGSVLIDPHTLQPMTNKDGSIYHFDPANLPEPSNRQKRMERQKSLQATDDFEDKGDPKQTAIYQENCVSNNCTIITEYDSQPHNPQMASPSLLCLDNLPSCEATQIERTTIIIDDEHSQPDIQQMHLGNELESPADQQALVKLIPATVDGHTAGMADSRNIVINDYNGAAGPPPGSQYTPMYTIDNKSTNPSKTAVQYVAYQPPDAELSASGYLVPIYEPLVDVHQQQQLPPPAAAGYSSVPANIPSAVVPIAYAPQMYHAVSPSHMSAAAPGVVGPGGGHVVYAAAPPLDVANGASGSVVGPQHHQHPHPQQYITFPVGYPYPYSDHSYPNYWPNNMTTYYVPQSMAASTEPHHMHATNSMAQIQYQSVGPSAFSQSPTNNQISAFPFPNKRSTPPHQHLTHVNAQPITPNQTLQMSSTIAQQQQPFTGHYSPITAATMIFTAPNMYPAGMVAAYPSVTPPQSASTCSPVQSYTSPVTSSPSPSVASSSNVTVTATTPPTPRDPSPQTNAYNTLVHTSSHTPPDANKPMAGGGSPTDNGIPSAAQRNPMFHQSNRFSANGSYPRPRNTEPHHSTYNYNNNNNNNTNHNHPMAFQPNKFKTAPQHKRPSQGDGPPHQPYNNNNHFHHSYQPTPLIAAGVPTPFRHANPAFADKFRTNGLRPRPPNLDLRRSMSMASSANGSPGAHANDMPNSSDQPALSTATPTTPTTVHHIPHTAVNNFRMANSFVDGTTAAAAAALHQHQQHQQHQAASFYGAAAAAAAAYGGASGGGSPGMYVKLGGAFFAHHPSISFGNHHHRAKVFPKEIRPQFGHNNHHGGGHQGQPQHAHHLQHQQLADMLPSMNMMMAGPARFMSPRASNTSVNYRNVRPR